MSLLYNLSTLFPSLERPHQKRDKKRAQKKTRMVKNPKVDHSQTDSMNLKVLRRDDPSIQAILGSASSITMYDQLDMSTTKWHRKNVEGSLFVVERKVGKGTSNSNSRFQFVVLNRLSDERFVESIAKDAEFELSRNICCIKRTATK